MLTSGATATTPKDVTRQQGTIVLTPPAPPSPFRTTHITAGKARNARKLQPIEVQQWRNDGLTFEGLRRGEEGLEGVHWPNWAGKASRLLFRRKQSPHAFHVRHAVILSDTENIVPG